MRAKRKRNGFVLMILCLLLTATGCAASRSQRRDFPHLALTEVERGAPLIPSGSMSDRLARINEYAYFAASRLSLPEELEPLGFVDARSCYAIAADDRQVLWLCDLQEGTKQPVIDYRDQQADIGNGFVFNQRWLVWLRLDAYPEKGSKQRQVSLMVRDLSEAAGQNGDRVLDSALIQPEDGFFMPFDSFALDGSCLVYRSSEFGLGSRRTYVNLVDLERGDHRQLAAADSRSGRMILHCTAGDGLVAWDMQLIYQEIAERLPALSRAAYSLYGYDLGSAQAQPVPITENLDCYEPLIYKGEILAVHKAATQTGPIGYAADIVLIHPELRTLQTVVGPYSFYSDIRALYPGQHEKHAIYRDGLWLSGDLLSWQSNVGDQHLVFDFHSNSFVELPLDFSTMQHPSTDCWVQPLPGLDAAYFWVGLHTGSEPAYVLRLDDLR